MSSSVCDRKMSDGEPCGRPIANQSRATNDPSCANHWSGNQDAWGTVEEEMKAILTGQSAFARVPFDFSGFHIPRVFPGFRGFTFGQKAHFAQASLVAGEFQKAYFEKGADFTQTIFTTSSNFHSVRFGAAVSFKGAQFARPSVFDQVRFESDVDFSNASFQEARFEGIRVVGTATWEGSIIAVNATFAKARFEDKAVFSRSRVGGSGPAVPTSFEMTDFVGESDFQDAEFNSPTSFVETTFGDNRAKPKPADFRRTRFNSMPNNFSRANVRSSQGLLIALDGCDVSKLRFEGVRWYRRKRRWILGDELIATDIVKKKPTDPTQIRIAIDGAINAYRRMIDVFDALGQTDHSEDFYAGVLRLRQLDPEEPWIARQVIRWYGLVSAYGSDYAKAFRWLLGVVVVSGLLFGLAGVEPRSSAVPGHALWSTAPSWVRQETRGLLHSFQIVSLQRETKYAPTNSFGHVIAVAETVLAAPALALFLLALNRRFKR